MSSSADKYWKQLAKDLEKEASKPGHIRLGRSSSSDVVLKLERLPRTNEWRVNWYQNGLYDEDKSAYTDDKQDAFDTLRAMEDEAIRNGLTVEVRA